jgi:hypothetical protein
MSSSNSANVKSRFDTLGRGDVREATAALRFSHTTHEEPVDYRELTPQNPVSAAPRAHCSRHLPPPSPHPSGRVRSGEFRAQEQQPQGR